MEMTIEINGSHVKDQILMLQQQVDELQKYNGVMVNKKWTYSRRRIRSFSAEEEKQRAWIGIEGDKN